ncbi:ATP-NAD kinase [Haloarchaeobius sp. HRN-SO-5]|uniref:ATP-NAD kinase n=1 Tax=Haloarchaeobius sp. HRN-SO-5 TaxID=3446118 RepID=UPI003EBB0F8F
MESAARDSDETLTVGVVGDPDGERVAQVEAAVADAGAVPLTGDPSSFADASFVVAVGERALIDVAHAHVDLPVLPVDAGTGVRSVPATETAAAVRATLAGDAETHTHRRFSVAVGEDRYDALFDVMLVTTEPARISEYRVGAGDHDIAQFRADGVVVATPAGSHGYANAAGGAVVDAGLGAASIVPVAPFAIDIDHWVVDATDVVLSVERDEGAVSLLVDDRTVCEVDSTVPVRLSPGDSLTVLRPPQAGPPW